MSIRPELFRYFEHFGRTVTVRELCDAPQNANVIALRHDIDHDLDLALEVAHHEHRLGLRATYFLLHTHNYWQDPDLALKCKQLEAYGHEVGLHLNLLTEWFTGRFDDVDAALRDVLVPLREAGVNIVGTSAHGDRACYEHGFSNYWIWRELRGKNPAAEQAGRSAEGVRVSDPKWQIPYPSDHCLRRPDGAQFKLWQSSLDEHGLRYDAMHVNMDHYWTDSGGSWKRTGDPLANDLSRGRHMVLIHPHWWRGLKKQYFFLSTARSGSTWLSHVIDRATNCKGVHEFTFNHRFENDEPVLDKRTSDDFQSLCNDRPAALNLLRQSLRWMRRQPGDVAEANVYLEPFLTELRELAPTAALVHLHRDGRDVVRSILNRGWYDNPDDHKHRALPIDNWDQLSRFERACWYWRYTNEAIAPHATARIKFESMVEDVGYLSSQLEQLGIVLHPLLAEHVFHDALNVSKQAEVPPHQHWPTEYQETFARICGSMQRMLGYPVEDLKSVVDQPESPRNKAASAMRGQTIEFDFAQQRQPAVSALHVDLEPCADGLMIRSAPPREEGGNRIVLLTTGKWNRVEGSQGIVCQSDVYYRCRVDVEVGGGMRPRLFVLFYGADDHLVRQFQAGTLRAGESQREFSFAPAVDATHFALALHMGRLPKSVDEVERDEMLLLKRVELETRPMDHRYTATPVAVSTGVHQQHCA